jgi:hypothetical protein
MDNSKGKLLEVHQKTKVSPPLIEHQCKVTFTFEGQRIECISPWNEKSKLAEQEAAAMCLLQLRTQFPDSQVLQEIIPSDPKPVVEQQSTDLVDPLMLKIACDRIPPMRNVSENPKNILFTWCKQLNILCEIRIESLRRSFSNSSLPEFSGEALLDNRLFVKTPFERGGKKPADKRACTESLRLLKALAQCAVSMNDFEWYLYGKSHRSTISVRGNKCNITPFGEIDILLCYETNPDDGFLSLLGQCSEVKELLLFWINNLTNAHGGCIYVGVRIDDPISFVVGVYLNCKQYSELVRYINDQVALFSPSPGEIVKFQVIPVVYADMQNGPRYYQELKTVLEIGDLGRVFPKDVTPLVVLKLDVKVAPDKPTSYFAGTFKFDGKDPSVLVEERNKLL